MIEVQDLAKRFGEIHAVRHVSFTAPDGSITGLLGPNGAGKTTTIEICEGLNTPDAGEVTVLGRRWGKDDRELRERLGISLQETQFSEKLTVEETVHLFRSFYRKGASPAAVIAMVQLGEKARSRVGGLSGGQKQRLALACALVGDPELLFLDEPTTGLDPQSRRQLWGLIEGFKSAGRSILLTTHYMEEAERLCDRVAIVDHGKMIALGTPRELIAALRAEHVLEFALAGNSAVDEGPLRQIEGVCAAARQDGTYRLQVEELHLAMPALLGELRRQGAQLSELRTHSATLEDVFVSLTGRHLRDE
jgi:ABC-2 type transport system ATP-binding protein